MNEYEISLAKFLKIYCKIDNINIKNQVTHRDIKTLMPELKCRSISFVKDNMHLIRTGEIILVKDANNKIIPYYKPQCKTDDNISEISLDIISNKALIDFDNLESYSIYELRKLLHNYKNERGKYKKIKKKLKNKGYVKTINKKKKQKYSIKNIREEY